jgi:hypothetical protein
VEACVLAAPDDGLAAQSQDFVLKVARPRLTSPPAPPSAIEAWLEASWEDPFKEVSRLEFKKEASPGAGPVRFAADSRRVAAFEQWKKNRDQWAKNEQPASRHGDF